jgi:hypothetical protein
MGAYLVESAERRMAITADDAHKAALWFVHRALERLLPMYDDDSWTREEKERAARHEARQVLNSEVVVRERGPIHCRTWRFDTMALATLYNELMMALTDLDRRLAAPFTPSLALAA